MKKLKHIFNVTIIAVACLVMVSTVEAASLKALLVSGQNNHNWAVSHPLFKQILDNNGVFETDIALSPPQGSDMSGFQPDFSAYDVVVLDYNGDRWPGETEKAFEQYVSNGGGVVIIHAADNTFPQWVDFNKMIGLGGWGGREKSGPYVYWDDEQGKIVRDMSPGYAGSHGAQHPYQVVNRVTGHPITKGMPEKWMHAQDELYSGLRGPAENMTVLSTAYDDPEFNGSGKHEPVLFTITYGQGRIFHTVLGHAGGGPNSSPAIQCSGFCMTLQRGAEWAATGKVTQALPEDFATATDVRIWMNCKPLTMSEVLASFAAYKYGDNLAVFDEIAYLVGLDYPDAARKEKTADQLVGFLKSDASLEAKQLICKQLSLIASKATAPQLADLLVKPEMSHLTRLVLDRIGGEAAAAIYRQQLDKATGNVKIGIINSLGFLGDPKAIGPLSELIVDSDRVVALAAIDALGGIPGTEATSAIDSALKKTSGERKQRLLIAYLKCADRMATEGDKSKANEIYTSIYHMQNIAGIAKSTALKGRILTSAGSEAGRIINDVLEGDDESLKPTVLLLVSEIDDEKQIKSIAKILPSLSGTEQIQLLLVLADADKVVALDAAVKATASGSEQVRITALKLLADLGDESVIDILAAGASSESRDEKKAAQQSLYRMRGEKVDITILAKIPSAGKEAKIELIASVGKRFNSDGAEVILMTAQDTDKDIRGQSLKVLPAICLEKHIPSLIELLVDAESRGDRTKLEYALVAASRKSEDKANRDKAVLSQFDDVSKAETKVSLVNVLGKLGCDNSLAVLRKSIKSDNDMIKDASIRALVRWPDAAPMMDLYEVAGTETDTARKTLALQSYLKLVVKSYDRPAAETIKLLADGLALADRIDEKEFILEALVDFLSPEAVKLAETLQQEEALAERAGVLIEQLKRIAVIARPNKHQGIEPCSGVGGQFKLVKDDYGDGTLCWIPTVYFGFNIDDDFCKVSKGEIIVELTFRDYGNGSSIGLQYDSIADGAYKTHSDSFQPGNSRKWRTVTWKITDGKFGNRQNDGADFRIVNYASDKFWVGKIKASRKP